MTDDHQRRVLEALAKQHVAEEGILRGVIAGLQKELVDVKSRNENLQGQLDVLCNTNNNKEICKSCKRLYHFIAYVHPIIDKYDITEPMSLDNMKEYLLLFHPDKIGNLMPPNSLPCFNRLLSVINEGRSRKRDGGP